MKKTNLELELKILFMLKKKNKISFEKFNYGSNRKRFNFKRKVKQK